MSVIVQAFIAGILFAATLLSVFCLELKTLTAVYTPISRINWHSILLLASTLTLITLAIKNEIRARNQAQKLTEENRKLNSYNIKVIEDERKAIAREIHDSLNAALVTIGFHLTMIKRNASDEERVIEVTEGLSSIVTDTYESARKLVRHLIPEVINTKGLEGALTELVTGLNISRGCVFKLITKGDLSKIDKTKSLALYRITQEATTNIIKHASASEAVINISSINNKIELLISDNGNGFSKGLVTNGIGLINMRERAAANNGTFTIGPNEIRGTFVKVTM